MLQHVHQHISSRHSVRIRGVTKACGLLFAISMSGALTSRGSNMFRFKVCSATRPTHLVSRTWGVAYTNSAMALVVEIACFTAPALVAILVGHVCSTVDVAMLHANLNRRKKENGPMNEA